MTNNSSYFYIGNILVQFGRADFGTQTFSSSWWETAQRSYIENNLLNFPKKYSEAPIVLAQADKPITSAMVHSITATSCQVTFLTARGDTGSHACKMNWVAIGVAA